MCEEQLATTLLQGTRLLLWIGAGISAPAGIPTDSAVNGLAHELALIHYGSEQVAGEQLGARFRLADLAACVGKRRVRDLLRQEAWQDLPPTAAHRAIAALVAEGFHIDVVTTNFDPLLEKAFREPNLAVNFDVVSSAGSVKALSEDVVALVKVHGCPYANDDPNDLAMLQDDLRNPPGWVTAFLNGRLQERVFVYVGFSGDAPYVRQCIEQTVENLRGRLNDAYAVDKLPTEAVFDGRSELGNFYTTCHVPPQNYSAAGSDPFLCRFADLVFRTLMLEALPRAVAGARRHVGCDGDTLEADIRRMSFAAVRSFARRLGLLSDRPARLTDVRIVDALEWMLILSNCGVLESASFRPALAAPFYPGPASTSAGPVVLLDGFGELADVCRSEIAERYNSGAIQEEFTLRGCARWYAVIVNCKGTLGEGSLSIVPKLEDTTMGGYSPVVCLDENSLLGEIGRIREVFQ